MSEEMPITAPVKDFPLLWNVYDHIVAHPQEWDQGMFVGQVYDEEDRICGTTFCFAGHAIMMGSPRVHLNENLHFVDANDNYVSAEEEGQRVLGLTDEETQALFYDMPNDLGEIRNLIAEWEARELAQ